ncbi:MAG: hypothetical protein ACAH11_10460 [Sphingomonas sp.]
MIHLYLALPLLMSPLSLPATQDPECSVGRATIFVDRFADLPDEIRQDILKTGKMAEPGEAFEGTDSITDSSLPRRRFVRGGLSNDQWFAWVYHGGFAPHYDVFGYRKLWETRDTFRWYRAAELQGDPCVAINAFLDGVRTPQRSGH